jgi:hypothetical protein
MPSADRKLELKVKTSMAQTASQVAVYAKGLIDSVAQQTISVPNTKIELLWCISIPLCFYKLVNYSRLPQQFCTKVGFIVLFIYSINKFKVQSSA